MCCEDNKSDLDDDDKDCNEFDTIDEQVYEFDFWECDIDDYLSKAWSIYDEGFSRSDSDGFDDREIRVFPTRYRLKDFVFTKSLRRVLNKNRDLKMIVRPFRSTVGKDKLYSAHVNRRFNDEEATYSFKNSYDYLDRSNIEVMEVSIFDDFKLIAGSIFFVTDHSVVSRRGFWDTSITNRSLGILTVLLEIKYALAQGKEFYYLGNYIRQDPNYHYKTRFPALELFDWDNESWIDYQSPRIQEMFNHRFRCKDDLERSPEDAIFYLKIFSMYFSGVIAAALVGSRARETAREDSDYNVVILTDDVEQFFPADKVLDHFHRWRDSEIDERGEYKILRVFFKNNDVFEFKIVAPVQADVDSINEETHRLLESGMKILHDPHGILEEIQNAVAAPTV